MSFDLELILLWAKKVVAVVLLPPLGPLLLIAAGLWIARRHRRGLVLAWLGLAAAALLSTQAGVSWLLRPLEDAAPLTAEQAHRAQAIVILAGGQRRRAPEYGGATVSALSLERVRYGARLWRETDLPILVSGGTLREKVAEAQLMRDALERDFAVPVRWTETESRDTRENARNSAKLLAGEGVTRILLVTHAAHMPRAREAFEAAGLEVIPAPTAWQGSSSDDLQPTDFVPSPRAASAGWYALHEWLGRLAYRISAGF